MVGGFPILDEHAQAKLTDVKCSFKIPISRTKFKTSHHLHKYNSVNRIVASEPEPVVQNQLHCELHKNIHDRKINHHQIKNPNMNFKCKINFKSHIAQ